MQMKMDFDKSHSTSFRFETENKSTKLLRQLNVMVCDNRKKKSHQQQYYSQNTFHSLSFLPTTPTQAEDHLPSW